MLVVSSVVKKVQTDPPSKFQSSAFSQSPRPPRPQSCHPEEKQPLKSPLHAIIDVQDCINLPQAGPGRSIEVKPAAQLTSKAGSALPYLLTNDRLDFQTLPQ